MTETAQQAAKACKDFVTRMLGIYDDEVLAKKLTELGESLEELSDGQNVHAVCIIVVTANEGTREMNILTARDCISPYGAEVMAEKLQDAIPLFVKASKHSNEENLV